MFAHIHFQVSFVVFGSSKAEVLQRILERPALPGSLPAQMVRPYAGKVTWFVDEEAAANLATNTWSSPNVYPSIDFKA
jgi:6-phosphogluconolactonase